MKSVQITALASAVGVALVGAGTMSDLEARTSGSAQFHAHTQATPGITRSGALAADVAATQGDVDSASSGRYIITFNEPGLVRYQGGVNNIPRTAPHVDGVTTNSSRKFEIDSAASQAYKSYLAGKRNEHIADIERKLGHALSIRFTYDVTRNGISAALTPGEAALVAKMSGVASVKPVVQRSLDTFRGPTFIGANTIWDGTSVPSYDTASMGEGVKVGVIDTGTYIGHPSFANDPVCGFTAASPKLFPRDCTTNNGSSCTGSSPNAAAGEGHGVHTSSTAAGNKIDNTVTPAPLLPDGVTMSGVAPCASVYSYRVADDSGSIYSDFLEAAFQNAITDQVDVANYSIGPTCGGGNPWSDMDFLDMEAADIFVAASAGNTRSTCTDPVGHVANNYPWVMTVAASTQDQIISPQLSVTGPGTPDASLVGIPMNPGSTTLAPADTTDMTGASLHTYPANPTACTASGGIASGTFTASEVAILRRGTCSFTEKITNAYNAGARMVVITNNASGSLNMNTTDSPTDVAAFSIADMTIGDALIAFGDANQGTAVGDYHRAAIGERQGDVLAGFSFRGPTASPYQNLTKPDITGPGVDIFAAEDAASGDYGLMSGTSMSSPHLAGSAALVRGVHPDWTPMEVKSALQTTATNDGFQEDGTTPWTPDQVGSGRVDLTKAALAGLTLDETTANFQAANPSGGTIDQTQLNLASLRNVACPGTCTWTRTFKNRLHSTGNWTISADNPAGYTVTASPSSFSLAQDATQVVTFTATGASSSIAFGDVVLHETGSQSPDQHLTVAVAGTSGADPAIDVSPTSLTSDQDADTTQTQTLTVANTGGGTLTWSVASTADGALWSQPQGGTSGIISDYSTATSSGGFTAADFQVGSMAVIGKITTPGFDNTNSLPSQSAITWKIYNDANGEPSGVPESGTDSPVWTYTAAPGSTGITITDSGVIALDIAAAGQSLSLPPGTYWLSVYPTYSNDVGTSGAARWNWFQAVTVGEPGKLIWDDAGVSSWTNLGDLTSDAITDVAFQIDGSVQCGASWLSTSPVGGSVPGGSSNQVSVEFDSTGLAEGTYSTNLCISSNDADHAMTLVPVTLNVGGSDVIFADGFDGETQGGGDACLDIDGFTTDDAWLSGSSLNTVVELDIGVGNEMTGASADATIEAFSPSWLAESQVTFSASDDTVGDGAINLTMSDTSGSGTETNLTTNGVLYFADFGLSNVPAGADGVLRLEWNENYTDDVHPNSQWSTSTAPVGCPGIHITCTDQTACDAAVNAYTSAHSGH